MPANRGRPNSRVTKCHLNHAPYCGLRTQKVRQRNIRAISIGMTAGRCCIKPVSIAFVKSPLTMTGLLFASSASSSSSSPRYTGNHAIKWRLVTRLLGLPLPLIAAFARSEPGETGLDAGISSGRLWAILRKFFDQVADQIDATRPQWATKLRSATPHWLRHTHASHALEGGADLTTVRDNLRHASLTTTSGYLHVDQARRSRQLGRVFGHSLKGQRRVGGAGVRV